MAARRKQLLGCTEPRVYTQPLRELTPQTSLGFAAIEFAETVVGVELYPWQKWLLIHALELREDGTLRFRTIILLVARQNGKTTLSVVLSLFFMYVLGWPLVLGTAQDLDVAEETWEEAIDLAYGDDAHPDLKAEVAKISNTNGRKYMRLRGGQRYKPKAANRKSGRSLSGDLVLLDELREHQSWAAWSAMTKTTMARPQAQVWGLSNAGDATSVVLRYLRKKAHALLGDPDGLGEPGLVADELEGAHLDDEMAGELDDVEDSLAIFEWSALPGCDITDRAQWAQANPSLGYGDLTERAIASACGTDPELEFRIEVLCQWQNTSASGPFPAGTWEDGMDATSQISGGSPIAFGVDQVDGGKQWLAVAGYRDDGHPHVELMAELPNSHRTVKWFTARTDKYPTLLGVAIQRRGAPASSLVGDLEDAEELDDLEVFDWSGSELAIAYKLLWERIVIRADDEEQLFGDGIAIPDEDDEVPPQLMHLPQPALDLAAMHAAIKPLGDGAWVVDRTKSAVDVAPLIAAAAALWALLRHAEEPETSAYDDHDLMILGG